MHIFVRLFRALQALPLLTGVRIPYAANALAV
jgi:hypothetical protein